MRFHSDLKQMTFTVCGFDCVKMFVCFFRALLACSAKWGNFKILN